MPRGITKRRPITVTALLDAAMELFAQQGLGATSIPDICARAGLTKGAFYSNFANKDALLLALLDRSWAEREGWIRRAMAGGPPGDEVLAGAPGRGLGVDRQWTLVSMEFSLQAVRHPEVAALLVQHERRVRAELALVLTEALEAAARVPTLPIDQLARMVVAVTEGTDMQVLTDEAAGATSHRNVGPRAVAALLRHFSVPTETLVAVRTGSR
jgi:AcrR family transcriptional regulator